MKLTVIHETKATDITNHEAHEAAMYLRPMSKLGEIPVCKVGSLAN